METITAAELSATDLRHELEQSGQPTEIARVWFDDHAEPGYALYFPEIGRAGIAHGADAQWTDCNSIEDAVERFVNDDMIN